MSKQCVDCKTEIVGKDKAVRCRSCAARKRYIDKHGKPPEMLIGKCEVCEKEFVDYASNHNDSKHNVHFCSAACRAAWTGVYNSISRGGDGVKRSKSEKDKIYYRKNAQQIRENQLAFYYAKQDAILSRKQVMDRLLKEETIQAYGGKCACCGESHLEFLTIDHTDGSGAEHRRQLGKGRKIYADLKARGFPQDNYRCLCLNCNIALGFYGYCPHQPDARRWVDKRPKIAGRKRIVV